MYYLVQAMEEYTDRILPSYTRLFSDQQSAYAYGRSILTDKCGFDCAEITALEVHDDPLADLTDAEYALATTPV